MFPRNILYLTVNETINVQTGGVSKKLEAKVSALKQKVDNCWFLNAMIAVKHDEIKVHTHEKDFTSIEIGVQSANKGYLNKINSDRAFYDRLGKYVDQHYPNITRIIFRYPYASLGLKDFTAAQKNKIVFEHNSKEPQELKTAIASKNYAFFSISPSRFFYWYQEKIHPVYCELQVSKRIFSNAYAGACVTTEIAEYEKQRNPSYKTFVSSNFYKVSEAGLSSSVYRPLEDVLSMGMIITSTANWYGLPRLFSSFSKVQDRYRLVIAGVDEQQPAIRELLERFGITTNVQFLGKIDKAGLASFYDHVHVCFGSLALYELQLNYASTLKVKESVSFGVPVVIAYNEEDFTGNKEFEPFYLQLQNNASAIDFEEIKRFATKFYAVDANKQYLKSLALKYLDANVKMEKFVENILPN